MRVRVLPSLLAADVGRLEAEARRAEVAGGDALHLDIMDGHFVPNLSFGPDVVRMAKATVGIPLSVHLMLTRPDQYIQTFVDAGADSLMIHIEAACDVEDALRRIRDLGVRPGITLNPKTPAPMVFPVMDLIDEVLCMTVQPGYGGQSFMPDVLPKIRAIRDFANEHGRPDTAILVDGGINDETAAACAAQGADHFVAGTWLFASADMRREVARLRDAAARALKS